MRTTSSFLAVLLLALAVPGAVAAASGPPALDQYVEMLPEAGGDTAAGASTEPGTTRQLPSAVQAKVRAGGGSDADALTEVATSPRYGAPSAPGGDEGSPDQGRGPLSGASGSGPPKADMPEVGALDAALGAGDTGSRTLVLLAVMAGSAVLVAALALARRRAR